MIVIHLTVLLCFFDVVAKSTSIITKEDLLSSKDFYSTASSGGLFLLKRQTNAHFKMKCAFVLLKEC